MLEVRIQGNVVFLVAEKLGFILGLVTLKTLKLAFVASSPAARFQREVRRVKCSVLFALYVPYGIQPSGLIIIPGRRLRMACTITCA